MAHVGMKYPVATPWNEDGTYGEGFVVGKAIQFTGSPNNNDVDLYADDGIAETDKSVKDLGTSLNVDDLSLKVQASLLGHEYTAAVEATEEGGEATPESIAVSTDDVAPFFGMGFYKRRKKNNVTSFTVIWLYKVQNTEPSEESQTKGDTTDFQTPTIEGKAYATPIGDDGKMTIMQKMVFNTEAEAKAWLNKKANITESQG